MLPKDIIKEIRKIEIQTGKLVNEVLAGEYHSIFKGSGMEFSDVRIYQEGDDIRQVDWNVTARTGFPHVKQFIEERELTIMLLADVSASGTFGSHCRLKREMAAQACAMLAFSAIQNNDKIGAIIFSNRIEKFIPPKKGRKHALQVIRELLYFSPREQGTSIKEAINYLNGVIKRRCVVFLVSDFLDEGYERVMRYAARKHDLIAINVTDPHEEELPDLGLISIEDPETGESVLIDSSDRIARQQYRELRQTFRENRRKLLRSMGVDQIELSTDRSFADPLVRFFKLRMRLRSSRRATG
ncbi:MAG: DUF58 domain-containing protein [bacterium]